MEIIDYFSFDMYKFFELMIKIFFRLDLNVKCVFFMKIIISIEIELCVIFRVEFFV